MNKEINDTFIRDNRKYGNVGDFLKENLLSDSELLIVSAYFTPRAYHALKYKLDNIKSLKFLFGEPTFVNSKDAEKYSKNFVIKNDFVFEEDSKLKNSNFESEKKIAKDCAEWIKNENIEIKSMIKPNFLHGKMYYINNRYSKELSSDSDYFTKSIVGSSNFTVSGLNLYGTGRNMELNLITDSKQSEPQLKKWFNNLWESDNKESKDKMVVDVKADVLKYLETIYSEKSPEFIYQKTLYHIFEKYLSEQKDLDLGLDNKGIKETKVWKSLYKFQEDGVKSVISKIEKNNGCILADSVGLGKTFEALAVITYFRNKYKTKILVICPKKLSDNWNVYTSNDVRNIFSEDDIKYDILYHTDLSRESGETVNGIKIQNIDWKSYGLIVIDESHNFRNDNPQNKNSRYQKLMKIIKDNNPKILLLSATPVNNNLKDIRNQIHLITAGKDDTLIDTANISNISSVLSNAQNKFNAWTKSGNFSSDSLVKELLESPFIKLMDELTISRSRKQIEEYYKEDMLNKFKFPVRNKSKSVTSEIDLETNLSEKFPTFEKIYDDINDFELSVYNPSRFVKQEFRDIYSLNTTGFDSQENREKYLIGMIRTNFLKRLESSIESFELSMERTINKIETLINKINKQDSFNIEIDSDIELDDYDYDNSFIGKLQIHPKHLNSTLYLEELKKDLDNLKPIMNSAKKVTPERDGKLAKLKNLIKEKVNNPLNIINEKPNKKVIIFTAFSDTANYLYDNLSNWLKEDLKLDSALVTGGSTNCKTNFKPDGFKNQNDFNSILINFSPISKNRNTLINNMPQEGEIDILIATDCISEGQNLQDCDYLINFDIHWNPVRIIQRFGRIDRLGSENTNIQMVNFWPVAELDKYIKLETRVRSRMALVDISATGDDNLFEEDLKNIDNRELRYRSEQLKKLKESPIDLEDSNQGITINQFNFDSFRMDMANFIKESNEHFKQFPSGLYSVVPSVNKNEFSNYSNLTEHQKSIIKEGVIFCFKYNSDKSYSDFEKINPLHPYFLVYIDRHGNSVIKNNNPSQILNIFHFLCKGITEPFKEVCDEFNLEINHGEEMSFYGDLIKKSISLINKQIASSVGISFEMSSDSEIPDIDSQNEIDENSFELITWLVIK